jgi:hypothetical protein
MATTDSDSIRVQADTPLQRFECHCIYYEPGLISIECENCKKKNRIPFSSAAYGVSSDTDQQAE